MRSWKMVSCFAANSVQTRESLLNLVSVVTRRVKAISAVLEEAASGRPLRFPAFSIQKLFNGFHERIGIDRFGNKGLCAGYVGVISLIIARPEQDRSVRVESTNPITHLHS